MALVRCMDDSMSGSTRYSMAAAVAPMTWSRPLPTSLRRPTSTPLMLVKKNGQPTDAISNRIPTEQAAFWSGLGVDPAAWLAVLADRPVALHGIGVVDLQSLQTAPSPFGIMRRDEGAGVDGRADR